MGTKLALWWALFAASVKMFVRNRVALFFSLFLPLIIMLIFGVLNFEGSTEIEVPKGQRTRYRVSGMDCASCAAKMEPTSIRSASASTTSSRRCSAANSHSSL